MTMDRYDDTAARLPYLWSIVLAGGEGKRLAPMVKQWLGEERPKQYCTFTGTRSMLQRGHLPGVALITSGCIGHM